LGKSVKFGGQLPVRHRAPRNELRLGTCVRDLAKDRCHQFQRALERGSVIDAISAAKAMGRVSVSATRSRCALSLAERDRARYHRAAVRWIARFLSETADASLEEAQLVSAALSALPAAPPVALPMLRDFVRARLLATVQSVLEDFVEVS
jgi:hypothetical protein